MKNSEKKRFEELSKKYVEMFGKEYPWEYLYKKSIGMAIGGLEFHISINEPAPEVSESYAFHIAWEMYYDKFGEEPAFSRSELLENGETSLREKIVKAIETDTKIKSGYINQGILT